ncbi:MULTISPECIES: hypothetical protein [unclassified Shinella]|uniref:hypothetical protein n=1 Tax=unclassified Shinella TaxID=2643062 RepID=UPI00234F92F2|nr:MULTISPECIES: hypothetical protein [unclassified Shinella]MCO5153405.1 hypothetical protein [Shinella sp.]MDC7260584.1 hypothetical protein [Shinella sp. HY16]MDC7267479.1 hypothetical protein [Shinella sp. YZ44]
MSNSATLFDTWNIVAAITVATVLLLNLSDWLRTRAYTQKVAAEALRDHLSAVDRIIDDPALPPALTNFVAKFNIVVSNKKEAREFYRIMMGSQGEKVKDTDLSDALNQLSRTRPDLVEGVFMVISKGLLCVLYRTSPSIKQVDDFIACLATEPRREINVASKYILSRTSKSGNLVPA